MQVFLHSWDAHSTHANDNLSTTGCVVPYTHNSCQCRSNKKRALSGDSHHWAPMMVSMLSAIRSRLCRLKLMPSVPMLIASDTPTVLKR